MDQDRNVSPDESSDLLIGRGLERIRARQPHFTGRWLLVDVRAQVLFLLQDTEVARRWPVSTAAAGRDTRQDSGGTPTGLHRIARKIGAGAEPGMIFADRQPTGILWRGPAPQAPPEQGKDLILTRILTLDGLEEGHNRGPGVDSLARYIYIHGTNHEARIGAPVSGGCVRLTNADVATLFDLVEEGDPVVIL